MVPLHLNSHSHSRSTIRTGAFQRALATALVASSMFIAFQSPILTAHQGPSDRGIGTALCRYVPQLCGG